MKTFPCFGLEFLGQCGYNPVNPTVYFSIGQLLSLLIITVAVYKILNPIIRLRIRANRLFKFKLDFFGLKNWISKWKFPSPFQPLAFFLKNAIVRIRIKFNIFYYLIIISIISVFISSIIPSIPDFYKIPVIGYPIFWEILSGSILTCLGIYFIKIINKPAQLNKHNCEDFFKSSLFIIERREEKELTSLARELTSSLETIITVVKDYEQFYCAVQSLAHEKYASNNNPFSVYELNQLIQKDEDLQKMIQLNEFQWSCFKIMDLLSDKFFCEIVSCKAPEFSKKFFSIAFFNYNSSEQRKIFGNILKSSFENENSILNRENQYDGLRGVSNLTSLVFENHTLLQQFPFYSIISWIESVKFTKEWQIELYFSCLKSSLKFSFDVECHQTLRHIHDGLLSVEGILKGILYSQLPFKKQMNLFNRISFEINNILYFLYENKGQIKTYSSNSPLLFPMFFHSDNKNRHYEVSLYHVLAKSIFDLILILSLVDLKSSDEEYSVRLTALTLLMDVLQDSHKKNKEILKILVNYIKFHISEMNFNNRHYPALTKYMILVFGLYYPHKKETEWDFLQCYLLDKLKKEFHSLYILEKKFALNLLPFSVSYDPSKKIMTQVVGLRFEKERTLQCE